MRKTGFGTYEIYYLKDYGNGYSREHVTTCDTREDAEKVRHCRTGSVLTSGQAKRINRLCGFPRGHKKNLWYCPECVREDITMHGETCWRRLPQMPGAVWCPAHGVALRESGTRVQDINYQLIPATYALMHVCDPEQETGTVYAER